MKKKMVLIMLLVLSVFFIAGCSGNSATDESKIDITIMNAEEIVQLYVDAGFPISNVQVYTAETDKNNLLGRPNQYTSKVNFADTRVDQPSPEIAAAGAGPYGGTIEVFDNNADAQKRYDYVKAISGSSSLFVEYSYLFNNVLLRIDGKLTPDQAAQYEAAFVSMQNGDLPAQFTE